MAKRTFPRDWSKCIICKADRKEKLECPAYSKQANRGQGYVTFIEQVNAFNNLADTEDQLDLQEIIGDSDDAVEFLMSNRVKWHKSCRSKFSATKIRRLEQRKDTTDLDTPSTSGTNMAESGDEGHSQARRQSARMPASQTRLQRNRETCMFCNNSVTGPLHAVSTKDTDAKIREAAATLHDTCMLAFLTEGDLIAQEAHYHQICYVRYLNKCRIPRTSANLDCESSLAFANIVSYLEENRDVVHKLSDLTKLYRDECKVEYVHATRLKERLTRVLPNISSFSSGRETLLSFKENISTLLERSATERADDDAVTLWRAASIIRNDLSKLNVTSQDFALGSQETSVPQTLLTLIKMILVGSPLENVNKRHQESLSISQIIVTNSLQRVKKDLQSKRITPERETPLPLYLGVYLYTNTRSRKIIDTLYSLGLSVSYQRVLSLSSDIAAAVKRRFENDGVVCPVQLKHNLFTTAAVDNLDYNPTSSTSKTSFHGTGISLFQHLQSDDDGVKRQGLTAAMESESPCTVLSDFTDVNEDVPFGTNPVLPPLCCPLNVERDKNSLQNSLCEEKQWLNTITTADSDSQFPNWAAYHAQIYPHNAQPLTIGAMLPLLENSANKLSTIKHVMDNVINIVSFLSPQQKPVLVADQPLFALAKKLQWKWPELYGEQKFVVVLGGLHIEMEFLKTLGTLLEGSGWTHALSKAGLCGAGTADSFLKASHVKRTRYAHLVTVASLAVLQEEAYLKMKEETDTALDKDDWSQVIRENSHQFFFWDLVMRLELLTLCLVKAFRTGDFSCYVDILEAFLPFLFALDKINYARWLSVHIRDMLALPSDAPEINHMFMEGNFVVRKSERAFSRISIDQAHEQNNEKLKGSLNVISLMETPATLQRWVLAAPQFSDMLDEFESSMPGFKEEQHSRHMDDSLAKNIKFNSDVKYLTDVLNVLGNPFLDASGSAILDLETGNEASTEVCQNIRKLELIGKMQYKEFVNQRLKSREVKVTDPLKKNSLRLMSSPNVSMKSKSKKKSKELQNTCSLFSQLYIACHRRGGDLDEFFAHENTSYPPALSNNGELRTSDSKSDLIPCILADAGPDISEAETAPPSSCIIYDGAVMVQLTIPSGLLKFGDYVKQAFLPKLLSQPSHVTRVDVVFDDYHQWSIKSSARRKRGEAGRRRVTPEMPIPKNWKDFLRNDNNKKTLFEILAKALAETTYSNISVYATCHSDVLTNSRCPDTLRPCHQEEADGRMLLHAADAVKEGHTNITIRTVDTDVVVLATALYNRIQADQIWIAFGTGKHFKYLPIHEIATSLGPQKTDGLLFFHAFTGCDSVSAFHGVGKRKAWAAWNSNLQISKTFKELSLAQPEITQDHEQILQQFTVQLYDKACTHNHVNVARKVLFAQRGGAIDRVPPTAGALFQHIKRACFQAGHVWAACLDKEAEAPSPLQWGWRLENDTLLPYWTDLPEASKALKELIKCKCKKACKDRRCKCLTSGLPCTDLCKCGGSCRI